MLLCSKMFLYMLIQHWKKIKTVKTYLGFVVLMWHQGKHAICWQGITRNFSIIFIYIAYLRISKCFTYKHEKMLILQFYNLIYYAVWLKNSLQHFTFIACQNRSSLSITSDFQLNYCSSSCSSFLSAWKSVEFLVCWNIFLNGSLSMENMPHTDGCRLGYNEHQVLLGDTSEIRPLARSHGASSYLELS